MTSSWPIVFGMFAVVIAALWYDATVASARAPSAQAATHAHEGGR